MAANVLAPHDRGEDTEVPCLGQKDSVPFSDSDNEWNDMENMEPYSLQVAICEPNQSQRWSMQI